MPINRIEDYALIGDCETAALVSRDGSIDWLCWPRFDSAAVFAALLGGAENGHWSLTSAAPARIARRYREGTLVLETHVSAASGEVIIIDFMPMRTDGSSHVVRIVRGCRGSLRMRTELALRFGYGAVIPWVTRLGDRCLKAIAGPDMVVLRGDVVPKAQGLLHRCEFTVGAGDELAFVLSYGPSFQPLPVVIDPVKALQHTEKVWRSWIGRRPLSGPYAKPVLRSLVTLKALTYRPTGGIVAAPTTSLPEQLGGTRNWDYRYCWLRDATFTLLALMNCGFEEEANAWRTWLRHAVAGDPAQVQVMYGLAGERRLDEWDAHWLSGYEGARPVRIGNDAAKQLQLDIYGEVIDTLFQSSIAGFGQKHAGWDLQCTLVEHLEAIWQRPDRGLWEIRGASRQCTHSKVMVWVALDRAIKSVQRFGVEGPVKRWRAARAQVHKQVCEQGYNAELDAFVHSYGSKTLDASALLMPLVGFLPASDPRVKSTVAAVERHLMVDGLVHRYDTRHISDGLESSEGAFLACSFWFADNLVMMGRRDDARRLFERLLGLANDVGLLAEEYDVKAGRMLGNFPQAFSHVALINTALNLSEHRTPADQRSGRGQQATELAAT